MLCLFAKEDAMIRARPVLVWGVFLFVGMVIGTTKASSLLPSSATSFQNEGTLTDDVTTLVSAQDGLWAPRTTGTVTVSYYHTGLSAGAFDALSVSFVAPSPIVAPVQIRAYLQKGEAPPAYHHHQHYLTAARSFQPSISGRHITGGRSEPQPRQH